MIGDVGAVASLTETIFKWVTEPTGFHELSLDRQLEKLHDAATKAIDARDYVAVGLIVAELNRLSDKVV